MTTMKRYIYTSLFCASILFGFSQKAKAQLDLGTILEAGAADVTTYLKNYAEPAFKGLGFGMNGGWYNTAETHNLLGVDLSVSLIASRVPTGAEFFTFNNSDYTNIYYRDASSVDVPTMFGPNLGADDLPQLSVRDFKDADNDGDTMEELVRLSAPTGLGLDEEDFMPFNAVPVPMAQLGIGLFKNTDLKVRYIPNVEVDDDGNSVKLFGLGLMHDIKQWLPGEKLLPIDLSVFLGFTSLETNVYIDKDLDQRVTMEANSFMAQAVVSKKLSIFTPYVGLGYASNNVNFKMLGNFDTETGTLTDPIDFDYEGSGFRANAGLRIKLAILTITGEYAFQEYDTYTVGIGFTFR